MSGVELKTIRPVNGDSAPPDYDYVPGLSNPAYSNDEVTPNDVGVDIDGSKSSPRDVGSTPTDDDEPRTGCSRVVYEFQTAFYGFCSRNETILWFCFKLLLLGLYAAYFIYAMIHEKLENSASIQLLWMTCLFVVAVVGYYLWKAFGKDAKCNCACASKHSEIISWAIVCVIFLFVIIFLIVDVTTLSKTPYNLMSLIGIFVYVVLFFIFSYDPSKVKWRPVVWGLALQALFAIFILRWQVGYDIFKWIGDRVASFLDYTLAGSIFVFGDKYYENFFAFAVLPTIVFFSTFISVLYYLGVMQVVVKAVAMVMQAAMGTTAGESLNAAGNIFVGQTEAPLMIRPLLQYMTHSELHAVMTGGFATIAGGVLAAFISFNVPANHLISASVMSAPAALAMAKLFYPETEKSLTTSNEIATKLPKSPEINIVQAAAAGASASISLVANVAANLIAFLALLAFIDGTLTWFGDRVGVDGVTFEWFCSWILIPFAFIMGVEWDDCRQVARLIGVKTFLNEFVAYQKLGDLIDNSKHFTSHIAENGTWYRDGQDVILHSLNMSSNATTVLENGVLSHRSVTIATYALCGFANIGSIGIQLGGLGAMAPDRQSALARVAVRAMIAGNVACFLTACIAGLFYVERDEF